MEVIYVLGIGISIIIIVTYIAIVLGNAKPGATFIEIGNEERKKRISLF